MKVRLDLLIDESEKKLLEAYCKASGRTKTDVLRELIRKLKPPSAPLKGGA